jgi:large subunit ribosomal protein L32
VPAPKKKQSKRNTRSTRAHDKLAKPLHIRKCPQCSEPMLQHHVCAACGYYRGKEVIEIPME